MNGTAYLDKLAHVQVVINCRARDAPMCTSEDRLAYILGAPCFDDVMSYNSLTTIPPTSIIMLLTAYTDGALNNI